MLQTRAKIALSKCFYRKCLGGAEGGFRAFRIEDGWEPLCDRLGVAVPDEPFPLTNTTNDMRAMLGLPALS